MKEDFENELNTPTAEKLDSLSNLFDFALLPKEQRLYIMFILIRGLQMMGRTELLKLIAMIETDTICKCECFRTGDSITECDCECPICNSVNDEEWMQKAAKNLWERMRKFGEECGCEECKTIADIEPDNPYDGDGDEDNWAEVIH